MGRFDNDRGSRGGRSGRDSDKRSFGGRDRDSDRGSKSFGGRDSGRRSFGGRDRGGSDRGGFGGRSREERRMHKVTCDGCGDSCEVPFKPTEGKPVYCDACFKKEGGSSSGSNNADEFAKIHEKLDKIMKELDIEMP